MAHFERDGIAFQYPETWTLTPEEYESGWAIGLYSPATAMLSLTLDSSNSPPGLLADAALDVLSREYKELDAIPVADTLANLPAVGHDVEFFALDLTNTCVIRAVSIGWGTLLVYWQVNDGEVQNHEVLRAICKSLTIAED